MSTGTNAGSGTPTRPDAREDRARLERARQVIFGEHRDKSTSNALYAVYVAVIAAAGYGVPAIQALLRFIDPKWFEQHLTPAIGTGVGVAVSVGLVLLAFWLGPVRGPVVPQLPYLDLVAASPIDRATSLRKHWRLSLFGCLAGGILIGLVLGAGVAIAGLAGPVSVGIGAVAGAVVGLVCAGAWLWGQVRSWPTGRRGLSTFLRARTSLRQLHIAGLREQAASSIANGGALLAGDLRAVRLNIASRSARAPRGRAIRLKPSGPVAVVVRRDLLGLRRSPRSVLPGVLGCAIGVAALATTVNTSHAPSLFALLSAIVGYLGFGVFAEGLRIEADNAGTTPLLGIEPDRESLAHLVVPLGLYAVTTVLVGVALVLGAGVHLVAMAWALLTGGVFAGGHLIAAFRGRAPGAAFGQHGGLAVLLLWLLYPILVVAIAVTGATAVAHHSGLGAGSFVLLVALGAVLVSWGRGRVRSLSEAHRD
ncbi:MAG TPA: DUF6297 family protein [Segeticoccus sp.]|uniref:DUF6297 family protein n=1 Tax=Segeticoccus sp. TaxID=2706531 RepID=UPI002D7F9676|nr:DUF6297 family protein [Segeticoccus sp.]HET8598773.1 DUF6297 family protein [Segeticoccus sp.]